MKKQPRLKASTAPVSKGLDCIFTKVLYHKHGKDGGIFAQKIPILRTFTVDNPLTEILLEMHVLEDNGDTVIVK